MIVLALGMAMLRFLVAAAESKIPFFKNSPIESGAGGAIAVFVIVLLLGSKLYA